MDFYDPIASRYDQITGSAQRGPAAKALARKLVRKYKLASAVDVACGTGLYALALARLGLRVVGSDVSGAMLAQARRSARREGLDVQWVLSPMQELARHVAGEFDAVLCMGNSIPHLLEQADLEAALRGFGRLVRPGGVVVIQLLNYSRVVERGERIVGIQRQGEVEYIRFYDFLDGCVRFNILEINGPRHRLHSTLLRTYTREGLSRALARCRFEDVEAFGGPGLGAFDPSRSQTLTLVGRSSRRPGSLK